MTEATKEIKDLETEQKRKSRIPCKTEQGGGFLKEPLSWTGGQPKDKNPTAEALSLDKESVSDQGPVNCLDRGPCSREWSIHL
jgi:hypothetical protein